MGTAISLSDCTVTHLLTAGVKIVKIVTPAGADDTDTIDCSSIFRNGCLAIVVGASDGNAVSTATSYSTTITLPGSTDDEERTIIAIGD